MGAAFYVVWTAK